MHLYTVIPTSSESCSDMAADLLRSFSNAWTSRSQSAPNPECNSSTRSWNEVEKNQKWSYSILSSIFMNIMNIKVEQKSYFTLSFIFMNIMNIKVEQTKFYVSSKTLTFTIPNKMNLWNTMPPVARKSPKSIFSIKVTKGQLLCYLDHYLHVKYSFFWLCNYRGYSAS